MHNYEHTTELTGDIISGTGSGVCELTNQSRLDIEEEGLKGTGAKTMFHTEYSAAAVGSVRKPICVLCIKVCKTYSSSNLKISICLKSRWKTSAVY